jgi:hypothetical protein
MGRVKKVAIATCAALPEGYDDDHPLAEALAADFAVWDDPAVDWGRFDRVIVRSPWDYTFKREAFLEWADSLGETLENRPEVLRWNSDKRYLADLAEAGLPVVETRFVGPSDPLPDLDGEVVVKPTISAGARDTGRFSEPAHGQALALLGGLREQGRTAMVQPYLPAVEAHGETAIVFFGGEPSHVLRKGAVLGADEVAPIREEGVRTAAVMWDPELVVAGEADEDEFALASRVIGHVAERFGAPPLYARVDMLPGPGGEPVLLELEAVEPCLYLRSAPGSAERLARLIGL